MLLRGQQFDEHTLLVVRQQRIFGAYQQIALLAVLPLQCGCCLQWVHEWLFKPAIVAGWVGQCASSGRLMCTCGC
jgi:predicted Kef-type K+ transport protein